MSDSPEIILSANEQYIQIDQSNDSIVYLANDDLGIFPKPTPFAEPGKIVIQDLTPLVARTSIAETQRAAYWNTVITDRLNKLGILSLPVPQYKASVFIVQNKLIEFTNAQGQIVPVIVSPYIPGPR
ncbi:hypothetical protein GF389_02160 [Candidatus Dojkabacteria bacterium]|nr:hypothetical protein [Candidatus Dojkabacteria bacterium]